MPKTASRQPAPRARNAEASRIAILEHAIAEFASEGVAGARTAAIAKAAGVNKALLYYYFKDKQSLYTASLHAVFSGFVEHILPMLESSLPPGEKLLRLARAHFEYLLHNPSYPRLIHQELSRVRFRGGEPSSDFRKISVAHFLPLQHAGIRAIEQGIASREFRKVSASGTIGVIIGMNVFYFVSSPIQRMLRGANPFSPQSIRSHIATSLDFLGASLFTDRAYGIKLARAIADAPAALPCQVTNPQLNSVPDGKALAKAKRGKRITHES